MSEMNNDKVPNWHLRLFKKSVLKQAKLRAIQRYLNDTSGKSCLDIGADNGVISFFLRKLGGSWKSADLDPQAVASIRSLVKDHVYELEGSTMPFDDEEFDAVIIIDMLEHLNDDKAAARELWRIIKPHGRLIVNVPFVKPLHLSRKIKHLLGHTDAAHGHLRPGYSRNDLENLLTGLFVIEKERTYSRFFYEIIDGLIARAVANKKRPKERGTKGTLITENDMKTQAGAFRTYSLIYPLIWLISRLDLLIFFTRGSNLIVSARKLTPPPHT